VVGTAPRRTPEDERWVERGSIQLQGASLPYRVIRSARRRKTIELTIDGRGVRISAPLRTPRHEIDAFVRSRSAWLLKHHHGAQRRAWRPPVFETGHTLPFLGRAVPLLVCERAVKQVRVTLDLLNLRIDVPRTLAGVERRAAIESAVRAWYRERADEEITDRVRRWSRYTGLQPSRVLVRDQRRRWGSCSPDGTLRFNWRLVMAPGALIDYVVAHELVHLRAPHHGPSFWRRVEAIMPDYEARKRALRDFGLGVAL
jgi:predicted metal-dependent hydrolase